jgi:hypothetical protein
LNISSEEEVVFARLEHGAYRDGVKFANGKEVSLQLLGAGVSVALIETAEKPPVVAEEKPAPTIIRESEPVLEPAASSDERILELID